MSRANTRVEPSATTLLMIIATARPAALAVSEARRLARAGAYLCFNAATGPTADAVPAPVFWVLTS